MNSRLKSEVWGGSPPNSTYYPSQRKCVPEEWAFYFEGRLGYISNTVSKKRKQADLVTYVFNPRTWEAEVSLDNTEILYLNTHTSQECQSRHCGLPGEAELGRYLYSAWGKLGKKDLLK